VPKPLNRVQLQKQESATGGGDQDDFDNFLFSPLDPTEDAPDVAGFYIQESGVVKDKAVAIYREDGEMWFEDATHSGVNRVNLDDMTAAASSGISTTTHRTLRQLIHFIDDGPAEGFASGAYKETSYSGINVILEVWYDDSSKSNKIIELNISYSGINPITEEWKMYDTDGSTVLATITDSITYTGINEISRTRTIV